MGQPAPCEWKEACVALWSLLNLRTAVSSLAAHDKGKRGLGKSLPIMKAEDFTVALELLQTLKVIYMNRKVSRQNLQSPGLMLYQQCLHIFSPNPGIPSSAFSASSPEILGRGIWHPSQTLLLYWSFPCTTGLLVLGTEESIKRFFVLVIL